MEKKTSLQLLRFYLIRNLYFEIKSKKSDVFLTIKHLNENSKSVEFIINQEKKWSSHYDSIFFVLISHEKVALIFLKMRK